MHVGESFNRFADFGLQIAHKCCSAPQTPSRYKGKGVANREREEGDGREGRKGEGRERKGW